MSWIQNSVTSIPSIPIPLITPPSGHWVPSHLCQNPILRLRHISLQQSHFSLLNMLRQSLTWHPWTGPSQSNMTKGRAHVSIFLGGPIYCPHLSISFVANAPVPPLPAMPNGRFSGQRLKADQTLINRSFENDSIRRTLLNRVLQSAWYQQHKMEPLYQSSKDDVTQGLDLHLEPRKDSVFKAFLSTNGKCQFGEVEREECPKVESKLRRALGHVRFHLGHRPFMCSGCQKCANRSE